MDRVDEGRGQTHLLLELVELAHNIVLRVRVRHARVVGVLCHKAFRVPAVSRVSGVAHSSVHRWSPSADESLTAVVMLVGGHSALQSVSSRGGA